jgi:hypothetical protein
MQTGEIPIDMVQVAEFLAPEQEEIRKLVK